MLPLHVGLMSPELPPARLAQLDGPSGFVCGAFDAGPSVRGSGSAPPSNQVVVPFDVMELEFMASSNPLSADEVDNRGLADKDTDQPPVNSDQVQAELEARICLPLQTPLIQGGPRLRHSRTPRSARSIRRSGRLAAKPRAANSTKQAQSVLLKKLGVHVDDASVDSEIQRRFKETFNGNMSVRKQRALQMLFSGDLDPEALGIGSTGGDVDVVEA